MVELLSASPVKLFTALTVMVVASVVKAVITPAPFLALTRKSYFWLAESWEITVEVLV